MMIHYNFMRSSDQVLLISETIHEHDPLEQPGMGEVSDSSGSSYEDYLLYIA